MLLPLATQYGDGLSHIIFSPISQTSISVLIMTPLSEGPFSLNFGNVSPLMTLEVTGVTEGMKKLSTRWIYNNEITPLPVEAIYSSGFLRLKTTLVVPDLTWMDGINYWNVLTQGGMSPWVIQSTFLFDSTYEMTYVYNAFEPQLQPCKHHFFSTIRQTTYPLPNPPLLDLITPIHLF